MGDGKVNAPPGARFVGPTGQRDDGILETPMLTAQSFDPSRALAALFVLLAVLGLHGLLAIRALANLAANNGRVRSYTTDTWRTLIILAGIVGPLAYFAFGSLDGF